MKGFRKIALMSGVGVLAFGLATACAPRTTVSTPHGPTAQSDQKEGEQTPDAKPAFTDFPDIPVPASAQLDLSRTVVFGGGEDWFGRIALSANFAASQLFDFYKTELPRFGWTEITSVRSDVSVLAHQRGERVATIQIQGSTLKGASVVITVSPKGQPASAPATPKSGIPARR